MKGTITHQLQKFTPTWARISSDHNVFCTLGEGGQRRGPMPLGLFLFFGGHLPQTSARSKQYLPVIFVRLATIRQNLHESWGRKLLAFNGIRTLSMKARTKVLASFEAGINSPNLPWHVNITSLKHRRRFEDEHSSQMNYFDHSVTQSDPKSYCAIKMRMNASSICYLSKLTSTIVLAVIEWKLTRLNSL